MLFFISGGLGEGERGQIVTCRRMTFLSFQRGLWDCIGECDEGNDNVIKSSSSCISSALLKLLVEEDLGVAEALELLFLCVSVQ